MNLLAIETSTETCSVAVEVKGKSLEYYKHAPREHAELLLPWVEQILKEGGVGLSSIDAIAFSQGPGSFTSLRIGIGIVQGLAWGSSLPVIPVSSLAATAQSAAAEGIGSALVALDARMNEVFTGAFEVNARGVMAPVSEEKVCSPENVLLPANHEFFGVGNGFERYEALGGLSGELKGVHPDIWPRASSMLQLAREWLKSNKPLAAEKAQPVYLRNNVAKKEKDR